MDFSLTSDQIEFQKVAADAVDKVVKPALMGVPSGVRLSADQIRGIYQGLEGLGYLGGLVPVRDGGLGMRYVDYGLLLESLARGPIVLAEIVAPRTIAALGNRQQKEGWLPDLLSGRKLSTAAITEPQAGSDLRGLTSEAVIEGEALRLNGRKKWIKFGSVADIITILVRISARNDETSTVSRLVLERDVSPWSSHDIDTTGINGLPISELVFEDVMVPRENVLRATESGIADFYRGVESSRALVGLQAVGIAQAALDTAVAYAKERTAFGRTLAKFQAIQISLADSAAALDAARLLCFRALWILDCGNRCPREASMAKAFATEVAVAAASTAMDCMGAFGLSVDAGVEARWRDAKMLTAIDGTTIIQKLIIGRELLDTAAFV